MPVTLPTAEDVRKARQQATAAVTDALEQARTPLYAALGAGNLATEKVVSYARKATQPDAAQARVAELQQRLAELPERLNDLPTRVRTQLNELSEELTELRGKLEPPQLWGLLEAYRKSMQELYDRLATRGEQVYGRLATEPRVKKTVGRIEHAADTAEVRVEKFVEEARTLADDVLGRVTRRTRSTGEKVASDAERIADETAEVVQDAGDQVASTARSTSRKAANRTRPAKPATRRTNSSTRKA
jgi:heparin binding hemagglutinin HbhA